MKISLVNYSAYGDLESPCKSWAGVSATLHPALAKEGELHLKVCSLVLAARLAAALLTQGVTTGCHRNKLKGHEEKEGKNIFKREVGKRKKRGKMKGVHALPWLGGSAVGALSYTLKG